MRTTLTIDDDIAAFLERETKRKGVSFKAVVNASLRRGLAAEQILPPAGRSQNSTPLLRV